ncbi:polysaccharide pyruvyl transferase CsaB [cyanobiont of Ornithocercus magnificus]|nr:polysaccharide pyruvyl transferase CsaB [cyanobiont of Ornithocercus magnificus]
MALSQSPQATAVLLCGYYGEGNLGDDALLNVLLAELPESCQIWVMARHVSIIQPLPASAQVVNRRSLIAVLSSLRHIRTLILGGGSLIQDSTSFQSLIYYLVMITVARCYNIQVILWAQGFGPLRQPLSRWLVALMLPLVSSASWRDNTSLKLARQILPNHSMFVAPDPVWCTPSRHWSGGGDVVVCWRPTTLLNSDGWDLLLDALNRLAVFTGSNLHWFAFHTYQDVTLPLFLRNHRPDLVDLWARSQYSKATSVDKAMDKFSSARLVLSMRLHALILSQLSGSPSAALSCDPKISAAANMALVPCTNLQSLPPVGRIVGQWLSLFDEAADSQRVQLISRQSSLHGDFLREALNQQI